MKNNEEKELNEEMENNNSSNSENEDNSNLNNIVLELQEQLNNYKKQVDDLNDRLIRKVAEFENYKRRTDVEQSNLIKYSGEFFVKKILPVIDDFERSIQFLNNLNQEDKSIFNGIVLVYEKLMKSLSEQGVSKIEALNKEFDVQFHEAIMQKPAEGVAPLTVIEEAETGYMFKDKVIRHTKVIVSSAE